VAQAVSRVVIMVQENHTTDNYFAGLAPISLSPNSQTLPPTAELLRAG
jgi:phospholipase C